MTEIRGKRYLVAGIFAVQVCLLIAMFVSYRNGSAINAQGSTDVAGALGDTAGLQKNNAVYMVCLGTLVVLILTDMLFVIRQYIRKKKEQLRMKVWEQEVLEQTGKKQLRMYQEMKEDAVRLKENLRRELETVKGLTEGGTMEDLECVRHENDDWDRSWCANAIVNAVLRDKSMECGRKDISFDAQVNVPPQLAISDYHLCSIFANLLDNAMEACMELPKQQRRILVHTDIRNAYLFIRMENSSSEAHALRPKREGHGLGTEIVAKIAESYGGEFTREYRDGMYLADVVVCVG